MAKKRNKKQYGGPLDAQELLIPYNNVNLPQLQDGGFQPLPEGYQHQMNFQFPGHENPRHYQQPARDYNEFFGPIAGQMGQIKQTALAANNRPMIVSSMMGLSDLGNYKYNPTMPKSQIPSMNDRGARRMQGFIQGLNPQQVNYMGETPPPTDLKSGIGYARGLNLNLNQVGPAIESAMYMKKKGMKPRTLPQLGLENGGNLPQLEFGNPIQPLQGMGFGNSPSLQMAQPNTNMTIDPSNYQNPTGGGMDFGGMAAQGMGQAASFGAGMLGGLDFFKREDEISKYKADIDIQGAGRQGALQGATSGFKAGASMFKNPFLKAGAGIIGGIAGLFGGKGSAIKKAEALQEQQNTRIDDTISGELTASRLSNLPTATANIPVAEMGGNLPMASKGGFLRYRGSKHTDPSQGIDVDESGSMSLATGKRPVAKVEDGELSFFDPQEQKPYVLSKKLGFAKQGDKLFNKYKLEDRQFGTDKALDDAITAQFMGLKTKQEDMKKTLNVGNRAPQLEFGGIPEGGTPWNQVGQIEQVQPTPWGTPNYSNEQFSNIPQFPISNPTAFGTPEMDELTNTPLPIGGSFMEHLQSQSLPQLSPGGFLGQGAQFIGGMLTKRFMGNRQAQQAQQEQQARQARSYDWDGTMSPYQLAPLSGNQPSQSGGQTQPQYTGQFNNPLYDPTAGGAFGGTRGRVFGQANMDPRYNNVGTMQYDPQQGGAFENMWPGFNVPPLSQVPSFTPYNRPQTPVDRSGMDIKPIERLPSTGEPSTEMTIPQGQYTAPSTERTQSPYSPTLSPLAHALSGAGNIAGYYAMKGARPEEYKPAARGYEQVDYSKERIAAQETADTARAVSSINARNTGNVGLATANQAVARTGVDRMLGQELSRSIQGQENMNAQLREGATRDNFMAESQAGLYNNQTMNDYRQRLASMNPWSTGLNTAASYLADNVKQQNYMTAMRMQNPNMDVYRDPSANWFNWLTANKGFANRYTGEPIQYSNES